MSRTEDSKVSGSCWRGTGCPSENNASSSHQHQKDSSHSHLHQQLSKSGLEAILVQGMNNLSFDELQREQEDLHGVANTDQENMEDDETAVEEVLESLDQHLRRIKACTAYHLAEARDPTYVHNRDFRMTFLRGNRYDPKKSAEQMIQLFALKHELFGEETLCRELTSKDLSPEDVAHLLEGSAQLGCCSDRSNRKILLEIPGLRSSYDKRSELRARFYVAMKICFELGAPSRGVVLVSYCVGQYRERLNGQGYMESTRLALAMPGHIAGLHLCVDDLKDAILARASLALMPAQLRAKTKLHYGSHQECQYLLSGYGIPREALPFTDPDNEIDLTYHHYLYKQWLQKEQEVLHGSRPSTPSPRLCNGLEYSSIVTPGDNDILCIGRRVQGSGGNDLLFSMVQYHAPAYHAGNLTDRRAIIDELIEQVRINGGRFLKLDKSKSPALEQGNRWVEVDEKESREKVQQMFRNLKRNRRGGNRSGSVTSSSMESSVASDHATMANHPPMVVADQISDCDVLVGKKNNHPGTLRLQGLVKSFALEYDAASRGDKKLLSDRVVRAIQEEHGGRFLKPLEDGRWEVISSYDAAQKVSNQFRNFRRKQR